MKFNIGIFLKKKSVEKYKVPLKYDKHIRYLIIVNILSFIITAIHFFLKLEIFQTNIVNNFKKNKFSLFFSKTLPNLKLVNDMADGGKLQMNI